MEVLAIKCALDRLLEKVGKSLLAQLLYRSEDARRQIDKLDPVTPNDNRSELLRHDNLKNHCCLVRRTVHGRRAQKGYAVVNAPPSLAQAFLVRRLAHLAIEHPGLDIDVATDLRPVSLERRETDIALRLTRPDDGDVIAKPLVELGFGFYGTEECCQRTAAGNDPVFVGFDEANAHLPEATWLARHFPNARMSFRANSQMKQAVAAREGAGLALLPYFVGKADPALKLCTLQHNPPPRGIWMVTRRQDRKDLPIHVVTEHLHRVFERERSLFEQPT